MIFERENRYLVFKLADVSKFLNYDEKTTLKNISLKILALRINQNRGALKCAVVEADWPEYERVWESIEERATSKV